MFYDQETEGWMNFATWLVNESPERWPSIRANIMDRCQAFQAGRLHAPEWFDRRLKEIEPLLALRWDFYQGCYIVERFVERHRCWMTIVSWKNDQGKPRNLDNSLIEAIQDGDMWRFPSPQAYLAYKRDKAAAVRARNEKEANERVMAAVDSLSTKQIKNFIEVERAIQSGETITAYGEDYKLLERMNENAKKAGPSGLLPGIAESINPGMHPKIYKRANPPKERIN